MTEDVQSSQRAALNRWFLLGEKRYEVLDLEEVERFGLDSFGDPDFVSIYGLRPVEWYRRGVRLLGRTAVECTRDRFADLIGRDVAALAKSAPTTGRTIVVDLFAGSGNTLYWITQHVRSDRSVGFELDPQVFELTRENLSLVSLGIDVTYQDYQSGLNALTIGHDELVVLFVSPPWGRALDEARGLDFRETTPPVMEIVDVATAVLGEHKLLFAIQAYEIVTPDSLAELTERLQWSALKVYDINERVPNPGLLLGSAGWVP